MATLAGHITERAVAPAEPKVVATARPDAPVQGDAVHLYGGRYGSEGPVGWKMLAVIAAIHAVLIAALCLFDVVHIGRKPVARLTVMDIRPIEVTPPPAAPAPRPVEKTMPVERPIMAPPPIVQIAAPPPPVVTAPVAPSPPAPSAPAAASASVSDVAPPISAPDGTAKTLGNPSPKYPIEARRQHQEGTVRLRVVITPEGRVKDISVARSSGFDALDDSALRTVRIWKFLPGKQAGIAIEAVGFLNIPFRLG